MATAEGLKSAFKTPKDLIGYIETHAQTPRALIHQGQLALAGIIAGWKVEVPKSIFDSPGSFTSLHEINVEELCRDARLRIAAGKVAANWVEDCLSKLPE